MRASTAALLICALLAPLAPTRARADSTDDTYDENDVLYISWYKYFDPNYVFDDVTQEGSQIYVVDEGGTVPDDVPDASVEIVDAKSAQAAAGPMVPGGAGPEDGIEVAYKGNGGTADVTLFNRGDGSFNISLDVVPDPAVTGGLVTLQGFLTVCAYRASDMKLLLAYPKPMYGIFFPPREVFSWTSPPIRGCPPGTVLTATFSGYGLGSAPSFYVIPGVSDYMMFFQ